MQLYYNILGVKRDASLEEIRSAYISKMKYFKAEDFLFEQRNLLIDAYNTLSNSGQRTIYDMVLKRYSRTLENQFFFYSNMLNIGWFDPVILEKIKEIKEQLELLTGGNNIYSNNTILKSSAVSTSQMSLEYLLAGKYDFKQVKNINSKLGTSYKLGHCFDIPVAVIGLPNRVINISGIGDIWEYGKPEPKEIVKFDLYSTSIEKSISNYRVYGFSGIERLAGKVKFQKIKSSVDYRSNRFNNLSSTVLDAEYKLEGSYSFDEIETMLKGPNYRLNKACTYGIQNETPTAVIGFDDKKSNMITGFRDVWEYGQDEPAISDFFILTKEEAKKLGKFMVYGCYSAKADDYDYSKQPIIEKIDRTFDPRFDFHLDADIDYRLQHLLSK